MKIKFSWFICFAVWLPTLKIAPAQSIEYVDLIPKIEIQQSSSNGDSSVSWYDTFRFEARDSTWQSILYANILNNRRLQLANHRFDSIHPFALMNRSIPKTTFIKWHDFESFPENLIKNVLDDHNNGIDIGIDDLLSSDFSNTAKKAYNKKSKGYLDGFSLINPNDPNLGGFIREPSGWTPETFDYTDLCYFVDSQLYSMDSAALFSSCINEVFSPFFFKNTEVTNNEYRAFVDWVRDSVIWEHLRLIDSVAYCKENYSVNCPDSILVVLMPKYFNDGIIRRSQIFDNGKLQYNTGDTSIYIYPDTLCWLYDRLGSHNLAISRNYMSHPAYDNYPVVGISWDMANAYLSWVNQRFKSYYFDRNQGIEVIAKLPSITQWKQANSLQEKPSKGVYGVHWGTYSMPSVSNRALFNFLHLDLNVPDPLYWDDKIHELTIGHEHILGCLICDGTLYPTSTIMEKHDKKFYKKYYPQYSLFNENIEISHTHGNVSEWMRHDFDTWNQHYSFFKYLLNNHYHDFYDYAMSDESQKEYQYVIPITLRDSKVLESEQAFLMAKAQYQDNVLLNGLSNGKLLMGANWLDERHSTLGGIPLSGIYAKTFKSSNYTSSTVGFRYVLEVREIEVQ
ncbi:MAG: SUMF1/EgtB/PvdO family nonheme iron enzyme [Bacteroidetes bacterium]|nr:SUMF1/EgtB/PvdO family nonheme iron enzyme [Bacteroidota bacterium]